MSTETPKYLYKYRDWRNEDHRLILKNNKIFFASAKKFNDPFDCCIPIRYDLAENEYLVHLYRRHFKRSNVCLSREEIRRKTTPSRIRKLMKDPKQKHELMRYMQEFKYDKFGIFSLAGVKDNILLWSRYSDSHKGFCIGFDAKKLIDFREILHGRTGQVVDFRKVEYCKEYPQLIPSMDNENENFKEQFFIKSSDWSYEQEYRLILLEATNQVIELDDGVISIVILGCNMSNDHKDEILEVLKSRPTPITFLQAKQNVDNFGLNFEEINY